MGWNGICWRATVHTREQCFAKCILLVMFTDSFLSPLRLVNILRDHPLSVQSQLPTEEQQDIALQSKEKQSIKKLSSCMRSSSFALTWLIFVWSKFYDYRMRYILHCSRGLFSLVFVQYSFLSHAAVCYTYSERQYSFLGQSLEFLALYSTHCITLAKERKEVTFRTTMRLYSAFSLSTPCFKLKHVLKFSRDD